VNKIFQNREADIVYKYKDKNIFFLIEHQTKIDYTMPYRILEYEIAIMKSAVDIRKVKNKEYKLPLVVPIVLYTGKKKWDAKRYLEESQETLDGVKIKAGNYNLVDINDFTKEELLQEKTLISKMMLLEKSESTEESIEMLEKIIPNTKEEDKELLKRVTSILFGEKIGEEKTKELIEKIDGGDGKMLAVVDMIRNENQMYINMGRKEGRKEERKIRNIEIAQKLLKLKMPITQISEVTELTEKEIKALKQS
jgi:predicted transposase/invertase (TIGR01784 family)